MTVLTNTTQIRSAIQNLLGDPSDERIVAVAYVGSDARLFLSAPAGVTIYCWPQPGGTNPVAIQELMDTGARVHFVKRLHAKIYWSRARGTIIGSANLTKNALGDGGLRETVVCLPPGKFDIQPLVNSLRVTPDSEFATELKELHAAHIAFWQRNPPDRQPASRSSVLPSFAQWLSAGDGRPEWRLGWYEEDAPAPKDAVAELEEEIGSRKHATFLGVRRPDDLEMGVFTLSFRIQQKVHGTTRISEFEWWAPGVRTKTKEKTWKDEPYVWFPRGRKIPYGTRPPFNHKDSRFRRALNVAIQELGGLKWLEWSSLKPSKAFLARLEFHYSQPIDRTRSTVMPL